MMLPWYTSERLVVAMERRCFFAAEPMPTKEDHQPARQREVNTQPRLKANRPSQTRDLHDE
jgi:hypothetical protein